MGFEVPGRSKEAHSIEYVLLGYKKLGGQFILLSSNLPWVLYIKQIKIY